MSFCIKSTWSWILFQVVFKGGTSGSSSLPFSSSTSSARPLLGRMEWTCKSSGQSVLTQNCHWERALGRLPSGDCSWLGLQSLTVRRSRSYWSLVLSAFHILSSSPVLTGRLRRPEGLGVWPTQLLSLLLSLPLLHVTIKYWFPIYEMSFPLNSSLWALR